MSLERDRDAPAESAATKPSEPESDRGGRERSRAPAIVPDPREAKTCIGLYAALGIPSH